MIASVEVLGHGRGDGRHEGVLDDRYLLPTGGAEAEAPPSFDLGACREWFAARGIARFKTPEHVVAVDALPLLASGKPDRTALKARAAAITD